MVTRPTPIAWLAQPERERCPVCDGLRAGVARGRRPIVERAALELLLGGRGLQSIDAALAGLFELLPQANVSVLVPRSAREWYVLRSSAVEGSGDKLIATELYPELLDVRRHVAPCASPALAAAVPLAGLVLPLAAAPGRPRVVAFPVFTAPGTAEPVVLRLALTRPTSRSRLAAAALVAHLLVHRLAAGPADEVARDLGVPFQASPPYDPARMLRYLPLPAWLVRSDGTLINANDPGARWLALETEEDGVPVNISTRLRAPWQTSLPFWEGELVLSDRSVAVVGWSGPTAEGRWIVLFDAHPESRRSRRESRMRGALASKVRELQGANARLEHLATLSSRFVTDAAHELKTPLAILRSYLDTLATDLAGGLSAEHLEFVTAASDGARRLHALVEGLLDLAALESGGAPLDLGPVDSRALMLEAVRELRPLARLAGVSLRTHATCSTPVRADRERLGRVVLNLLENAVKYGRSGGHVELHSSESGDRGVLVVRDDGPGIPTDVLPSIFDEFARGPQPRSVQGSGLGLAIARRLVVAMGGRIWAESTLGVGSTFSVELPLWTGQA